MFEFKSLLRLLSIIASISMLGASISGFIDHACDTEIILSIHIFIIGILMFYYEFFNNNKIKEWFYHETIFRTLMLSWNNILILGMNNVCLGLGIFNIIVGLLNGIYYIINKRSIDNQYNDIDNITENA